MLLSQHTINGFKHYLTLFFMAVDQDFKLSKELQQSLKICEQKLANGTIDELTYEHLIHSLINELNEHMVVWKMLRVARASQFFKRGASFLVLVTAPDIRTCIQDITKYKQLFLTDSYQSRFITDDNHVIFEVSDVGANTPLPHIKYDTAIVYVLFVLREVAGNDFDFDEIHLPKDRPEFDPAIIASSTKAKIILTSGSAKAVFKKSWLSRQNAFYDKSLRSQIISQLEALIKDMHNHSTLTHEVTQMIKRAEKPAAMSLEKMAEQLGKSVSTFRRNLGEEKTSFKVLQNKVLDELCIDLLLSSDIKIDALALKLGYSERSTFERSFRNKFGTTPAKLREFRDRVVGQNGGETIESIINNLPPLNQSCVELIKLSDSLGLDLDSVIKILDKDPVFAGRIMGLASKAIYGATPNNLAQAVGRNLGLETVKNLAVLFSAQDGLSVHIKGLDIETFISGATMSPRVFKLITRNIKDLEFDSSVIDQTLIFGSLGTLVLCHSGFAKSGDIIDEIVSSNSFYEFVEHIYQQHNQSLFSASALLLSVWGINNEVIKLLTLLDAKITENKSLSQLEELIMLTYATCTYLTMNKDTPEALLARAEEIGVINFAEKLEQMKERT